MIETKRYAENLRFAMLRHGLLQEIKRGKYRVISNDIKKAAICFEQAERQYLDQTMREATS
jgi:hypothetical protein